MKVTLIASTSINPLVNPAIEQYMSIDEGNDAYVSCADTLAEFAGRACYQSFHKPNPATRSNKDYMANILSQCHFSVLEHGSATFYLQGVSRNLTHELIRHRHLSFSELSQRFVDMTEYQAVIPPNAPSGYGFGEAAYYTYNDVVDDMYAAGFTRKQGREAARAWLPSAMETKMVVTGNHRTWREVISKRISPHADAEIQELARKLLAELKKIAPNTYQDFE